jgi:hypothetical protein
VAAVSHRQCVVGEVMVWEPASVAVAQPDDEHCSRLRRAVDMQRMSLQMRARCGGRNSGPLIG